MRDRIQVFLCTCLVIGGCVSEPEEQATTAGQAASLQEIAGPGEGDDAVRMGSAFAEAALPPRAVVAVGPPPALPNLALGKPATQSSTLNGGVASRAVDGNLDTNWLDGSVSHTDLNPQAWWQVDLGAVMDIGQIVLYNRTDCCSERLADFAVLVSREGSSWDTVSNVTGMAPPRTALSVSAYARFVRVQLQGTNYLSLAEVQVFPPINLALGQPAAQSSTLNGGSASRAVDGNTDGNWDHGSVSHTDLNAQAWWQVDLGAVMDVGQVVLYNRTDCCRERLSNFDVWVSTDGATWAKTPVPGTAGDRTALPIYLPARFVRVQLRGTDYLSLTEVQVFPPANLAAGKTAIQSSTLNGGDASRAVDGNLDGNWLDGSVSHTDLNAQAGWQVDLGAVSNIGRVVLYNRTDCCSERLANFQILGSANGITWPVIGTTGGGAGPRAEFSTTTSARFVRVQLAGTNYLSLAEVQVFGQ